MKLILDDNGKRLNFAPFTLTRPVGNLRIGILTNDERWKCFVPEAQIFFETADYLSDKYAESSTGIYVDAGVIPNADFVHAIIHLKPNHMLVWEGVKLAKHGTGEIIENYKGEAPVILNQRWDLYQMNDIVLASDFELLTRERKSQMLSDTNTLIGSPDRLFIEEGAKVEAAIINVTTGPVFIGRDVEIMEGCIIRGGLAMLDHSVLKLGTKIYGPTTIGPYCKVGGEVNNCIFYAYSNKGHDGFLGNSIIGEWCNLGADTNTSNLKNNYGSVKTYNFESEKLEQTDIQFMGLMMGDHSKCGINTMFNTASVVGVSTNVFGADFPPKYTPSFRWGSHGEVYAFDKAVEAANNMMSRRGLNLSEVEVEILRFVADNY